jgi:prepilin-type processing-associated H-X9-DG protein
MRGGDSTVRERLGRGFCAFLLGAWLAGGGCSSSPATTTNQKPVHPVKGQVFVGNQPAAGAFVLFVPVNEPQPPQDPRPRAEVKEDGSFALSTYGEEDGAPYGFHPGGCMAGMCDGSVRHVSRTISVRTFARLITSQAGEVTDNAF